MIVEKLEKMSIKQKQNGLMWFMFIFAFTAGVYGGRTEEVFANEFYFNIVVILMCLSAFITMMFGKLFYKDFLKMVGDE